jgi:hypothetical protein
MRKSLRRLFAVVLCCLLLSSPRPAHADSLHTIAVEVIVSIVAVSAAITVGIVLAIKHHPSLKGCAANGPDGLQLTNSEGQTYLLIGDVAGLKPGDRIRVSGQKQKNSAAERKFIVEKSKVYGPCPAGATS